MSLPECEHLDLEKRGQRRCYAPLNDDLEIDGWTEGDEIDWDTNERGDEIIYCVRCHAEFTEADFL